MENNKKNDNELLFIILLICPLIGGIVYLLCVKPQNIKKIVAIIGIIPVANFVAFVILLLDYLNILTLDKETIEVNTCTETNCGCEKVQVKEELENGSVVKETIKEEEDAVFVPETIYSSPSDVFDEEKINSNPSLDNSTQLTKNSDGVVQYDDGKSVDFEFGNLKEE